MNKVNFNEEKILELLGGLKHILRTNHEVLIPELDKLENIVKNKSYENSNIERIFSSAFRRIQEIGICDEEVDRLFKEI